MNIRDLPIGMRELFDKLTLSPDIASNNKRIHIKNPKSLSLGFAKD